MTNPASPPVQAEGVAEQRAQSDLTNKVGAPLAPQKPKDSKSSTWKSRFGFGRKPE